MLVKYNSLARFSPTLKQHKQKIIYLKTVYIVTEVGRIGVLAVPLHRKSALCWDQQRLGKSIDRKYPPALLKWNHAVSDGCGRLTARRRCLDRVRASARCRNGWGPGGSNPKVAQPCWHVYVVDLVRLEMGLSVYGGTGRLPLLSSFLANHLRSQETRYILSAFLTIPLKVNQSQKTFESLFEIWNY